MDEAVSSEEPAGAASGPVDDELWNLEAAVRDGELHLQAWRDLIVATDVKCLQLMGYLVTVGALLVTAAASVVVTGGLPMYMALIPFLGGAWMLFGFVQGIKAITGDIPMLGMPPSRWLPAIDKGLGRKAVARGKLVYLEELVEGAGTRVDDANARLKMVKDCCVWSTIGVLTTGLFFVVLDVTGWRPLDAPLTRLPTVKVEKVVS
jgi:hypothetical protein